jgi:acyl dehydratase
MPPPARQLYFEGTKVGDELLPMVRPPIARVQLVRYAAASNDFNPLYVDEVFAKHAGFPSVFAPGMLTMGFCAQLATEWLRGARVTKLAARFVKVVWPGDVLTLHGRVIDRHFVPGGKYLVDIEIWIENQRGELVVRANALAQLFYDADDEARQRAGKSPRIVTQEEEAALLLRVSRTVHKPTPAPVRPSFPTLTPVDKASAKSVPSVPADDKRKKPVAKKRR